MPSFGQRLFEIFAIGSIASIWIYLILAKITDVASLATRANQYENFMPLVIFVAIALVYQLGWFMNILGWVLLSRLWRPHRKRAFAQLGVKYEAVRPLIYQKASAAIVEDLRTEIGWMQMGRANTINFFLITFMLLMYGWTGLPYAAVFAIGFAALAVHTHQAHKHHYDKLLQTYKAICLGYKTAEAVDGAVQTGD
ncbi:MAG: hypothetical protein BA863_07965 [Desulfovibrio sp. S3730MH75]|nr:MAG: hypothetical protein BA863_07965 [Desulfovibrio sp. S3730MH75]